MTDEDRPFQVEKGLGFPVGMSYVHVQELRVSNVN